MKGIRDSTETHGNNRNRGWGQKRKGQIEVSVDGRTGRWMKNMETAPTMGTSPIRGSRITRIIPFSYGQRTTNDVCENHWWIKWQIFWIFQLCFKASIIFLLITFYSVILSDLTLKVEKKTHLYSFNSSFAEVPLHLNVDLYIANIAEETRTKMSSKIMPS